MGHWKGISIWIGTMTALLVAGWAGTAAATPADATAGAADKSLVVDGFAQVRWQYDHIGDRPTVPSNDLNYFQLRRMRLRITGDWNQYFRVRIQLALQELVREVVNNQVLEDLFIRFKKSDAVELQLGQYKMPISREELRSSSDQLVIDRSPIVNGNFRRSFLISRDIGLQFGAISTSTTCRSSTTPACGTARVGTTPSTSSTRTIPRSSADGPSTPSCPARTGGRDALPDSLRRRHLPIRHRHFHHPGGA